MKATLQFDGSLRLSAADETRVIRPGHPAFAALMRLYSHSAGVALSAAPPIHDALPTYASQLPTRGYQADAEPKHVPPPGFGGNPWVQGTPDARIYDVPIEHLHRDPQRPVESGNSDDLALEFDPHYAGVLAVWKDPSDGLTYAITGDQRLTLAERSSVPTMRCHYITAKNEGEARAIGTLIRLATGRGTAADAERFRRDTGHAIEDMQRQGMILKDGIAAGATILAPLNDALLTKVQRGLLKPDQAIPIANWLANGRLQEQFAGYVAKQNEAGIQLSAGAIEEMTRRYHDTTERKAKQDAAARASAREARQALQRRRMEPNVQVGDGARPHGGGDVGPQPAGERERHSLEPDGLTGPEADHWTIRRVAGGFGLFRDGRNTPVATADFQDELLARIHGCGKRPKLERSADKEAPKPVLKLRPIAVLRRKPVVFPTAEEILARVAPRGISAEVRSETLRALRKQFPQLGTMVMP